MNMMDLLEASKCEPIVIDNISFPGGEIVIVDFGIKGYKSSFSIPLDAKVFLNKLAKEVPKTKSVTPVTATETKPVATPQNIKACKKHPDYKGERKPRCSNKNPDGCPNCWNIYRTAG